VGVSQQLVAPTHTGPPCPVGPSPVVHKHATAAEIASQHARLPEQILPHNASTAAMSAWERSLALHTDTTQPVPASPLILCCTPLSAAGLPCSMQPLAVVSFLVIIP
jgi:hypothetical protein